MPKINLSSFKFEKNSPISRSKQSLAHIDLNNQVNPSDPKTAWPDILRPNLLLVFVGFNPGVLSGKTGYHYAHASNRFWKLLHESGLTEKQHQPSDDALLPELYQYGFTDLVARCTRKAQQLSPAERLEGARILDDTITAAAPKYVCLVGKGIWQSLCSYKGWTKTIDHWGLQPSTCVLGEHSRIFVVPSTSGLVSIKKEVQLVLWKELAALVEAERGEQRPNIHIIKDSPTSP